MERPLLISHGHAQDAAQDAAQAACLPSVYASSTS